MAWKRVPTQPKPQVLVEYITDGADAVYFDQEGDLTCAPVDDDGQPVKESGRVLSSKRDIRSFLDKLNDLWSKR